MATINIDGEYYEKQNAKISVYDHGLLYGDGVFEGLRIYNNRIFKLEAHTKRLFESAQALSLKMPMDESALNERIRSVHRKDGRAEGYIRIVVTRGVGDLGLNPLLCPQACIIIIIDDIQLYPQELYEKGISVVSAATQRLYGGILDPRIKSLNYLNNILGKMEARQSGCLEAVLYTKEGYVTECTGDNIFIVKDGVLKTPAAHLGLLKGITRDTILELASGQNISVEEGLYTRFDLYTADECFLTGSGAELMPVTAIDGRIIGKGTAGPVFRQLADSFKKFVCL